MSANDKLQEVEKVAGEAGGFVSRHKQLTATVTVLLAVLALGMFIGHEFCRVCA